MLVALGQSANSDPRLDRKLRGKEVRDVRHDDVGAVEDAAMDGRIGSDQAIFTTKKAGRVARLGTWRVWCWVDIGQGVTLSHLTGRKPFLVATECCRLWRIVDQAPVGDYSAAIGHELGIANVSFPWVPQDVVTILRDRLLLGRDRVRRIELVKVE